jgi:hypothetical protein
VRRRQQAILLAHGSGVPKLATPEAIPGDHLASQWDSVPSGKSMVRHRLLTNRDAVRQQPERLRARMLASSA